MQVVCPGCRQTLTLPPTMGGVGAMICPLCGAGFMPPSAIPSPVNPAPYGAYPHVSKPVVPTAPAQNPIKVGPREAVSSAPRITRTASSKGNPFGLILSIVLGGIVGIGAAGYLISRTNFVTRVRQGLGVEKTREQIARERNALEKSLDEALKDQNVSTVPSERAQTTAAPSSSGSRPNDDSDEKKPSFSKLAGQAGQDRSTTGGEMDEDPSRDSVPGPPRVTFSDLIDPETGEPRPAPTMPGDNGASTPAAVPRPRSSQKGITLPPLDSNNTVEVVSLDADRPFDPQHLRLLSSAKLPEGAEFVMSSTRDDRGCVVTYQFSASAPGIEIAVFRADKKSIRFSWVESDVLEEIREQLRNTMVAYTTSTAVKHVALRKCQAVERAVLDLDKERTEWSWPIDASPKASDMYIEFGSVANLPHNPEMRGNSEVKVGAKGAAVVFRGFTGAQLTIASSLKKGEFVLSITPEFVERDGDRFSLAESQLDNYGKSWEDVIARNKEKLAQFEAQAKTASALIEKIEGKTARDPAEAATMIAQKRAAAQKIQGLRSSTALIVKLNNQFQARLNGLPKVREAVDKLKGVAMPPFVVYTKVGNQRIELLEHNP